MKLAFPSQMKIIDTIAIDEFHIPGILLMDNASLCVAQKAREMLGADDNDKKRIVIVAGKGNNGGDAFACARYLHQWGYIVQLYSLVPRPNISADAAVFTQIVEKLGIDITYIEHDIAPLAKTLADQNISLIIDGIFGTGVHGLVSGIFTQAIAEINQSGVPVLSIDIPSGVDGKTGQLCGCAVKADETVTFSLPKPGLCQYPGAGYCGTLTVADIAIPQQAIKQANLYGELLDPDYVAPFLPPRPIDGHKGTFGKLLIITGSSGMTGAGTLAAKAALKTGSGLVYLAVPGSCSHIYNTVLPEAITFSMAEHEGAIASESLERLQEIAQTMDAVVIGPGLSTKCHCASWVNEFIASCPQPIVIDADALSGSLPELLPLRKAPTVITPHPGEFSRLTGISVEKIQQDRVEIARKYSQKWHVTVILKGAGTVIAYPDGHFCINTTGHPGMAVAGSGDVLAGMLGSLLGQRVYCEKAAALGVYLHGRCGELLSEKNHGQAGFFASELCNEIPIAVGLLSGKLTYFR